LWYSVFAFFSIRSDSPVPRIACNGPWAAATALPATDVSVDAASTTGVGPALIGPASAFPPSSRMRVFNCRACPLVSFRCSRRRFLYGGRVVMAMWASSAVSSSLSLPYASLRYWINFVSLAFGAAIYLDASLGG
jgi:hypothetical protein